MNITKETIEILKSNYSISFFDEYMNEVTSAKATEISIGFEYLENGNVQYVGKRIKATKKEITFDYIINKIQSDKTYKNFSDVFGKLIKSEGFSVYPTSYGIGVFCAVGLRSNIQESKNKIEILLKSMNIQFKTEYSDAGWVFRYKISKTSENIKAIEKACL